VQETGCRRCKVAQWSDCGGRFQSAGRTGKHVTRCGNPFTRLATQKAVRPALPLLWCLGATDHGRTLEDEEELERTVEISRQTFRSKWRPWYRELVVSRTAGR
jgi:hypothetical protein